MKATALHSHISAFLFLTLLGLPAFAATWYVSGDGRGGDGSRANPFSSLPEAEKASAAGDTIVLVRAEAPYEQGIALKEGQTLTADEKSSPVIRMKEGAAVAVRDAGNVSIRGITIELAEAGEGIVLTNAKGTVAVQGGGISGRGNGTAVLIEGGEATISFDAFPISQSSAAAVVIRRHRGPSVFFRNGSPVEVTAGTRDAVSLTDNAGSYAFSDPLNIATRGARALVATDSGTFTIAGPSTLSTSGAAGIQIARTAVSIQLSSVTVEGLIDGKGVPAADGVLLEQVSGTFVVAGGAIRSVARRGISIVKSKGVAIQNVQFVNVPTANAAGAQICGSPAETGEHLQCAAAVHLHGSEDVTLQGLRIAESAQLAVNADTVRNLTLTNVEIRGAGDELNEHGLQLRNISGELKIHGTRVEGSTSRQMHVLAESGEVVIDIRNSAFGGSKPPEGGQGVLVDARGDARLRMTIDGSSFTNNFSNGVQLAAAGNADVHIEVLGSTFQKSAAAVSLSSAGASTLVYRIENNKISGSASTALNVHTASSVATRGEIARNVIGVSGKSGSGAVCGGGCNGISVTSIGGGASSAVIAGNTVQQVDGAGIQVRAGGNGSLAVRIAGNIVREPSGADTLHAISVMAGLRRTDSAAVCAEVGGPGDLANTITGAWNAAGGGASISLMKMYDRTRLSIADYAGGATNADGLSRFVAGRNRGGAVEANPGSGVTLADRCSIP